MKLTAMVNNLPENMDKWGWIVARPVGGELWFYGAWYAEQGAEAQTEALEVAREVDGIVLKVEKEVL